MFSWHIERLIPCGNFLWSVGKWSTKKLMSTFSRSPVISRKKSEMASKPSSPRTKRKSNLHSPKVSKPNSSVNNTNSNGRAVKGTNPVSVLLPSHPNVIQKKSETTYSSTFMTSRVPGSSARGSVTDLSGKTQYYQPPSISPARQQRQRQKFAKVTLPPRDVTKSLEQLKLSPPRNLPPTPEPAQRSRTSSVNSLPTELCAGSRHSPSQLKNSNPSPHQRSQSMTFSQDSSQQENLASKQNQSMDLASKNQTSSGQPQTFPMNLPKYSKQFLTDKQSQSMDMSYSSKSGSVLTKSQSHPVKLSTSHGMWDIQPEILVDVTPSFYGSNYPLATSRHASFSEPTLQTSSGSLAAYEHPRLSWSSGYKSNTPSPSLSPSRSPSPSSIVKLESKGSASSLKSLSSTSSTVTAVTKSTVSSVRALMTQSLPSQFDKNDIPVVKVGISSVVDPVRNGLVGLRNLGNTCYMNSMLHCLSNTKKLTTYFLNGEAGKEKQSGKGGLVEVFTDLLKQMWEAKGTGQPIIPSHIKQKISQLSPTFHGHQQHDAQEFLQSLLFLLHDELNKPKKRATSPSPRNASDNELAERSWRRSLCIDNSHISNLFMGQLKSTLTCLKCQKSSVTFDPFWDISLPLPPNNQLSSTLRRFSSNNSSDVTVQLKDCFKLFATEEKLDGDNRPVCAQCNGRQTCAKKLSIQRFPEILVLHIKRFSCGRVRTKLETQVNYPKTLSILPEVAADKESVKSIQYELYGVVNHWGTLFSGHYTADCKHPKLNKWHKFNDSLFDVIPSPVTPSKSAYILFYEKKTNSS